MKCLRHSTSSLHLSRLQATGVVAILMGVTLSPGMQAQSPLSSNAARPAAAVTNRVAAMATNAQATPTPTHRGATTSANSTNKAASADENLLKELLKLSFDRRPTTALRAMAKKAGGDTALTNEIDRFQASVAIGDWAAVKQYLAKLPEKNAAQVYRALLQGLQKAPMPQSASVVTASPPDPSEPPQPVLNARPLEPVLLPEDVLALADAKPASLDEADLDALGKLAARALRQVPAIEGFVARLDVGTANLGGKDEKKRSQAAVLLLAANRPTDAVKFLPATTTLIQKKDYGALDLQTRSLIAAAQDNAQSEPLRRAWDLTQMVLADKSVPATHREVALQRALDLMPLLSKELGRDWLRRNFQKSPGEGMAILATIGATVAQGYGTERDAERRRKSLDLQRRTVEELLETVGPETTPWQPALNIVALGWLQEAERSKLRHQPRRPQQYQQIIDYDPYGNPIYNNYYPGQNSYQNPNEPAPISIENLLPTAPGERWLAALDKGLLIKMRSLMAELYLKNEQEEKALPFVELLAPDQPVTALTLANELLRSWARTKDPNAGNPRAGMGRVYYNPYGGIQQMAGVPLTRLVQVRGLAQLTDVLARLRQLPIGALDEKAVVAAFSATHSQAEVFRMTDVEQVLGKPDEMKVETLAELLQTMRERLARQWRQPAVQQQNKTKRTDKDIQAEINRGYEMVIGLTAQAVAKRPDEWRLWTVNGAAHFDWAEYQFGKEVALALYTGKRDQAFEMFQKAASLYTAQVGRMDEKEWTPIVFQQWFNATLGASDLAFLTRQQKLDTNRIDIIRAALWALPADALDRHLALLGKGFTDSINGLPAELKPRYLKAGLRLVGEHESAEEARKQVAYYDGLLEEVQFLARLEGDAVIGHGSPFGLHLVIRHSDAVGRESGGFAKYLQNQQNSAYYYNPMGGGPVNYRDDLEKKIREALSEGFEIVSVTFHDDKVEPRGFGRPEWRETPIAYVLLKAKDARVDRIPALQFDLDFLDRRGKVILPIESPIVLLDARPEKPPARPLDKLVLTQILDERELKNGKLTLEIKATGQGIIPELNDVLDPSLPGFTLEKPTDQGLTVTKMEAGDTVAPVTERNWVLNYVRSGGGAPPATFQFPRAKLPTAEVVFKRYADADLLDVKESLALAGLPLQGVNYAGWSVWALVLAGCGVGLFFLLRQKPGEVPAPAAAYALPAQVTPFSVLNLLRRMEQDRRLGLPTEHRTELAQAIRDLEQRYFGRPAETNGQSELEQLAREWVGRTS